MEHTRATPRAASCYSLVDMPRSKSVFDIDALGGMGFLQGKRSFHLRSSMVASNKAIRAYWQVILKNPRSRRPPLATVSILVAMITVHYVTTTDRGTSGIPYTTFSPWYSALGAMFSHVSITHLWSNVMMLSLLGSFLEFTEGFRHVAAVSLGSGLLGAAAHGAFKPTSRVRGASGAIYGIMASQLALLALNWGDMPARYIRLLVCASVLLAEVLLYYLDSKPGVSYMSHLGGAATGLCISLVFSTNVRLHRREVILFWLGCSGYTLLVVMALVFQQLAAGCLAAILIPFLVLRSSITTHRAFVRRLTQSQLDANSVGRGRPGHRRSTVRPILQHGTHKVLTSLAQPMRVRKAGMIKKLTTARKARASSTEDLEA